MPNTSSTELYRLRFPNGKIYFGISKNSVRRLHEHLSRKSRSAVSMALRRFGKKVALSVLCVGPRDYVAELEAKLIALYKTNEIEFGYNLTPGGERGFVHSDVTKTILRQKTSEQYADPQARQYNRDVTITLWKDPEWRERVCVGLKKTKGSKQSRIANRQRALVRAAVPTERARLARISKEYNVTLEARARNSANKKLLWADPIWRARIIARQREGRAARRG